MHWTPLFSVLFLLTCFAAPILAGPHKSLVPDLDAAPAPLGDRFVGRKTEFGQIDQVWADRSVPMVGVVAWGGYGKTAMIRQWLYRHRTEWPGHKAPDGIFWYTVQPGTNAEDLYQAVMAYFHSTPNTGQRAPNSADSGSADSGSGDSVDQKIAALQQAIGQRRYLLVLDGLEPLQHAERDTSYGMAQEPLLRALLRTICLSKLGNGLCVVTTRLPLTDVAKFGGRSLLEIRLEERLLDDAEANLLLRLEGVKKGTDLQKMQLIEFCCRHPLALKVSANLLRCKAGGDAGAWPSLVDNGDSREPRPRNEHEAVATIMHVLSKQLTDRELAELSLLADIPHPIDRATLCARALRAPGHHDLDEMTCNKALDSLVSLRVVDFNEHNHKFAIHPLVAEYFGRTTVGVNELSQQDRFLHTLPDHR